MPGSITNLVNLYDDESNFCNNRLFTDDAIVREFLNQKQQGGDWESCQTPAYFGDFNNDGDVDGSDLSIYAAEGNFADIEDYAASFGKVCYIE